MTNDYESIQSIAIKENMTKYCIILLCVFFVSCNGKIKNDNCDSRSIEYIYVYNDIKIDSNLNVVQNPYFELKKITSINDSVETRSVIEMFNQNNKSYKHVNRIEILVGENLYRVVNYNNKNIIVPWLITKKDSCTYFSFSKDIRIAEKNCFEKIVIKNSKRYYQYKFLYYPDGAETTRLFNSKLHLIKEEANVDSYLPYMKYKYVGRRLIYVIPLLR